MHETLYSDFLDLRNHRDEKLQVVLRSSHCCRGGTIERKEGSKQANVIPVDELLRTLLHAQDSHQSADAKCSVFQKKNS